MKKGNEDDSEEKVKKKYAAWTEGRATTRNNKEIRPGRQGAREE